VGHDNAVQIEEVGQAVQFPKKKKSASKAVKNGGAKR
jgi:inorganic phosphate transporter, PiT family